MHIAEGMLPLGWAAAYTGIATPFLARGIWDYKRLAAREPSVRQLVGALTAAVFVISLLPVPVPVTGTCSHPGGTPLAAVLAGPWLAMVMALIALLFQALFLAHGGLTTLGANTLTMGIFGGLTGYLVYRLLRRFGLDLAWAAGCAGFLGDLSIYLGSSLQLALAIHGTTPWHQVWKVVFAAYLPTQLPLALLEGILTGLAVGYVAARRPDLLARLGYALAQKGPPVPEGGVLREEK
ncbi:ABC-type Co2+ transport system, permease component [Pelotomaculum thermopropionicum SI]|uniref:Cobalt transport protein CbiM n=1 Tax=Pelotomaculum thermopropionicum (strain DSM 13744 / JCM 10971 / SI) TaxID=370438 RepID=A5D3Q0_PELTS|nr:ABC-type Co2+ transport system, permease component [Pelotomaculum thermopropionicum SI]